MRSCNLIAVVYVTYSCVILAAVCIEPISGIGAGAALLTAAIISGYHSLRGMFMETCSSKWIHNNITGLPAILHHRLYGQHLVLKAVSNHIRGHIRSDQPTKALALSFHGWTGTGKNYVSRIIAEHLYKEGMNSKFVHLISATKEFPHEGMVPFYRDQLRAWIEGNVTNCPQSLFIFDEMDKMPPGLIDTIKPYLDYYDNLGGVIYRKAIFLFLSNTAGNDITTYVLQHWKSGSPREDIKLSDIEKVITRASVNVATKSGLWHSELITKHMITAYIPFLPLERSHVRECIKDNLVANNYTSDRMSIEKEDVDKIMSEMSFYPETEQLFSVTGCKRVAEKVHFIMEDY